MDNEGAVDQVLFLPWLDVKSTNTPEVIGIILFFGFAAFLIYYLFNKKKEKHETPHIHIREADNSNYSFLDDKDLEISEIHSTLDLPKGVRVSLQKDGNPKQYDATVINVSDFSFTVFINNDPEHTYNPEVGEKTIFFTEINNLRWSFSTDFDSIFEEGVKGFIYNHTYDIYISKKRKEARLLKDVPALFSVIPRNVVLGPIPIQDLIGNVEGHIPSTISDISASGCAIHTRSPLAFNEGDLAIVSFLLPDSPQEQTLFASVNNVRKVSTSEGGGSILNLEFIKISAKMDDSIRMLVNTHIEEEIIM